MQETPPEIRKTDRIREKGKRGALNVLFGRTGVIIILLLVQVIVLIGLFARWQYSLYAYGGTYLVSIGMAFYLINHDMNPITRSTWLVLVMLFPVVGTLLYAFMTTDIGHRLARERLRAIYKETSDYLPRQDVTLALLKKKDPDLYGIVRSAEKPTRFPVYTDSDVLYYPSGEAGFDAMLEALRGAKQFIFLETFIIAEGELWSEMLDILEKKAAEGVEVRVLYDGTNAIFRLPYRYPEKLRAMGIACKMFSPLRPMVSTYHNNRDHRKILVIDGQCAFTGGTNIADEYANRIRRFGHWKDTSVQIRGSAVKSFTLMFLQMWSVSERTVEYRRYLNVPVAPCPNAAGYVMPYGDSPFDNERIGESIYLNIIHRACEYVRFMTPYLIIDSDMENALAFAAKRGVQVELVLPHIPDKKSAFALAYTHYRRLLEAGVRIFEYEPGFVHAKVCLSDHVKAVVGTINLDYRSLLLHFECAAYLYKMPVIAEIERDYLNTRNQCVEITLETLGQIPAYRRVMGRFLKVFAPLM